MPGIWLVVCVAAPAICAATWLGLAVVVRIDERRLLRSLNEQVQRGESFSPIYVEVLRGLGFVAGPDGRFRLARKGS